MRKNVKMPKINARSKGAAGEREFCVWLKNELKLDFLPTRNLEQVREGGADIMTVPPFAFEVKRCQGLAFRDWWRQVSIACVDTDRVPVVAYRQNGKKWKFLLSAKLIGLPVGFIQLEEIEGRKWLINKLNE